VRLTRKMARTMLCMMVAATGLLVSGETTMSTQDLIETTKGAVVKATTGAPATTKQATTSTKTTTSKTTTSKTTTTKEPIRSCECLQEWTHNEFKCNSTSAGQVGPTQFRGCPTLQSLSTCELEPKQSWCKTTRDTCLEQEGDADGEGWVFCSPISQTPEIPKCTCAQVWLNGDGEECASSTTRKRTKGCPTLEELQVCNPGYTGQSWCLTNEKACTEQIDCPECSEESEHEMLGYQWSYCDATTQSAELPDCECEESWTPEDWKSECPDWKGSSPPVFNECPTPEQLARCNAASMGETPWCTTKQARCKQQSASNEQGLPSMINDGWSYCTPEDNKPILPPCECKETWIHDEDRCTDDPLQYSSCPSEGELRKCDPGVNQPYCDTTYTHCAEQNYEAKDDGWVYCKPDTVEPELPQCECMDLWRYAEPGSDCTAHKTNFRGCPTQEQLNKCEEDTATWCLTKDEHCKEQRETDENVNQGWVYCDPTIQLGTKGPHHARAIGLTFIFTVVFCGCLFIGFMFAYRSYLIQKKAGFSKSLLHSSNDGPQGIAKDAYGGEAITESSSLTSPEN